MNLDRKILSYLELETIADFDNAGKKPSDDTELVNYIRTRSDIFKSIERVSRLSSTSTPEKFSLVDVSLFHEAKYGTGQIPPHINLLNFEFNLDMALKSASVAESILNEYRGIVALEINNNYIKSEIIESGVAAKHQAHDALVAKLELNSVKLNSKVKITAAIIDTIQYTIAAKLAGRMLYGISFDEVEPFYDLDGVLKIRDSLRKLLRRYREIENSKKTGIFSLELKFVKGDDGEFIIPAWSNPSNSDNSSTERYRVQLNRDVAKGIRVDLREYFKKQSVQHARINRVGFEIHDAFFSFNEEPKSRVDKGEISKWARKVSQLQQRIWNVSFTDKGQSSGSRFSHKEVGMATENSNKLHTIWRIPPTKIYNLKSSLRGQNNIQWTGSSELLNYDPVRVWNFSIESHVPTEYDAEDIRSILLHFDIDYD